MATFELQGPDGGTYRVTAPDEKSALSAFGQFHASPNPVEAQKPDKYREAAEKEFADLKAAGVPVESGYGRRVLQGMTLGGADEILAGAMTPLEMFKRGTLDPREAYKYAKARENVQAADAARRQGIAGDVAEVLGGIGTGGTLARSGVTLARPGAGLAERVGASVAEGVGYGGVSGFLGGGDSFEDRFSNAGKGAAVGGAVGGALPVVGALTSPITAPVLSSIRARVNPQGVAESQFARAVSESGMTPQQLEEMVRRAAIEGQGVYTAADAMGNSGQRMLSTVARAPGAGRQHTVDFLDTRQADQARRVAQALSEGLDTPQTAMQLENRIGRQRSAEADTNYGAAREQAGAVDVSRAVAAADDFLTPGVNRIVNPGTNIADDSIESAVRKARGLLTDGRSQISDFQTAHRAKIEIDNLIENGTPSQQRVLIPIRNALDDQLAAASQPYANARDTFRRQSQQLEAIPEGRTAAQRGRSEDTIPAFRAMRPDQQAGFRTGYGDNLIEGALSAAPGVNKARPLMSDATQAELQALAPMQSGNRMARRIGRENQMFETRRQATGGSQTADNLADMDAQRIDPSVMGPLLHGNVLGAGANALHNTVTNLSGYTPAVRQQLATLLLGRGTGAQITAPVGRVTEREARLARIARILLAASQGGAGVGVGGYQPKNSNSPRR